MIITSYVVCIVLCWYINYDDDRDSLHINYPTPRAMFYDITLHCVVEDWYVCHLYCEEMLRYSMSQDLRKFRQSLPFFMPWSSAFSAKHKRLVYSASSKAEDYSDTNFYRQKWKFRRVIYFLLHFFTRNKSRFHNNYDWKFSTLSLEYISKEKSQIRQEITEI